MESVAVTRSRTRVMPDPLRIIAKPYLMDSRLNVDSNSRVYKVVRRVLAMSDDEVVDTLRTLRSQFLDRHENLDDIFRSGFSAVSSVVPDPQSLSDERLLVLGAYFSHEYSIESAAITNPSIAPHPNQTGMASGKLRIIVTLRAIGEGHRSSIEFRTGEIDSDGNIRLDLPGAPKIGERHPATFDKRLFVGKLNEMGEDGQLLTETLRHLDRPTFSVVELDAALVDLQSSEPASAALQQFVHAAHWVASSNYELTFPRTSDLSERVLFPGSPTDSHGMEDARLVRFVAPDGEVTYFATYTAYDGFNILPQLISTTDFETFRIATLNGRAATNKGMALFPRLIDGRYMALARSDAESNFLMSSADVRNWDTSSLLQVPKRPWELLQIGNAGSPIETDAGWLVITHAVGPMRRYTLGAILLDIDDPLQIIGELEEPLLEPDKEEREGYVPNVVYSCGSVIHNNHLVIAYGASDTTTRFATLDVDSLLSKLTTH